LVISVQEMCVSSRLHVTVMYLNMYLYNELYKFPSSVFVTDTDVHYMTSVHC